LLTGFAKVMIDRYADMTAMEHTLHSAYPRVPLASVGFTYCCMDKGKRITALQNTASVTDVARQIGRGKLILMPLQDIPIPEVMKLCRYGSHANTCRHVY